MKRPGLRVLGTPLDGRRGKVTAMTCIMQTDDGGWDGGWVMGGCDSSRRKWDGLEAKDAERAIWTAIGWELSARPGPRAAGGARMVTSTWIDERREMVFMVSLYMVESGGNSSWAR